MHAATRRALPAGVFIASISIGILSASSASAQTVYFYTGNHFTLFSCGLDPDTGGTLECPTPSRAHTSYTGSNFVAGTLSFDTPLPRNLPLQDVSGRPGFHLTLSDGHQTLSAPGAAASPPAVRVRTDGDGAIVEWLLLVYGPIGEAQILSMKEGPSQSDRAILFVSSGPDGDFAEVPGNAGTWTTAGGPTCTIQLNKSTFTNGDPVTATIFDFANTANAAVPVEIKVWLEVPNAAAVPLVRAGADSSVSLPAHSDTNLGPVTLFTVSAQVPRGAYAFSCRIVNPVTGKLQDESLSSFVIQ